MSNSNQVQPKSIPLDLFNDLSHDGHKNKKKNKRLPPFSLRLSQAEREQLIAKANGVPLGRYIRKTVLGKAASPANTAYQSVDPKQLALVLAALGRSRLASNLNQIAKASHCGTLESTPELHKTLINACNDIRMMRNLLVGALGVKSEDGR